MLNFNPHTLAKRRSAYGLQQTLRSRWALHAAGAYLVLVWAGVAVALSSPPNYETGAIILVRPAPLSAGEAAKTAAAQRPEQIARPQITLLESENVIRRAIAAIGESRLYPGREATGRFGFSPLSPHDAAYAAAKKKLSVRSEPQTDLIRVAFRHNEPEIGVAFVKALIEAFTVRYLELYGNAGAANFFWEQKKRSDEAFARSSADLVNFSVKNRVFLINEQRRLLLDQRNGLASSHLSAKGMIVEKESQAAAIPAQLAHMKPISRLPQITGLTQGKAQEAQKSSPSTERLASDPPLLLVKVYQDTIATLVKLETEVTGLRALATHQEKALQKLDEELGLLSGQEAVFERLQLEVAQAKQNSELLTKRALQEQLNQEMNGASFSSIQVVQDPAMPLTAIWPIPSILVAIGLILSLAPLVLLVVLRLTTDVGTESKAKETT